MIVDFFIPGEFTTLNQFIAQTNSNRHAGAEVKKAETNRVRFCAIENRIPEITEYPVDLHLTWYRKNQKSDPDNIAFAIKFVLDGLQTAGVLRQDTWACVKSITHEFRVDKQNPGVSIAISKGIR